jgi:hypothetical protein
LKDKLILALKDKDVHLNFFIYLFSRLNSRDLLKPHLKSFIGELQLPDHYNIYAFIINRIMHIYSSLINSLTNNIESDSEFDKLTNEISALYLSERKIDNIKTNIMDSKIDKKDDRKIDDGLHSKELDIYQSTSEPLSCKRNDGVTLTSEDQNNDEIKMSKVSIDHYKYDSMGINLN